MVYSDGMQSPDEYKRALTAWRKEQEDELRRDDSWLCVVALGWLKEGVNPLDGPLDGAGSLTLTGGTVTYTDAKGAVRPLKPDADTVTVGTATFQVLKRGARIGVRVWDTQSENRRRFKGRLWFPPDPALRIDARFVAYPPGKTIPVTNVLGDTAPVPCAGYVTFALAGKTHKLDAQKTPTGLFLNFRDATSGKETYPAGRFLETDAPSGGKVVVDFNRATNPPCAFTDHATCPLPPPGNAIAAPVRAGERFAGHGR